MMESDCRSNSVCSLHSGASQAKKMPKNSQYFSMNLFVARSFTTEGIKAMTALKRPRGDRLPGSCSGFWWITGSVRWADTSLI